MDGTVKCAWSTTDPLYVRYHDEEWGRPRLSDRELFERICLEGFQAGLAWITILRKRPAFREVFFDFDLQRVAKLGARDVKRLMGDARIIRSEPKILAAIGNAQAAQELIAKEGSLAKVIWSHAPQRPKRPRRSPKEIPPVTAESEALSKTLRKAGFRFVGPTTMYALFQAAGVVNDHLESCPVHAAVDAEQRAAAKQALR